jgi:hypothetical protein
MTRDEWLKVREEPYIPLGVWFEFFKARGGDIEDPIEFEAIFSKLLRDKPVFIRYGHVMTINEDTARYNLSTYYNSIFGL